MERARPRTRAAGSRDDAVALAIRGLGHLASEPERLSRFLALTGLDPAEIRTAAREPGFLAGVLEYLAADEALLVAFASEAGVAPDAIEQARLALAGQSRERESP